MVWGPGFWHSSLGIWVVQFGDLGFGIHHWGFGLYNLGTWVSNKTIFLLVMMLEISRILIKQVIPWKLKSKVQNSV